jgi:DNA polymerase III alpha subunit (gram-positive type)
MLVDDSGKPLKGNKSKEEVTDILKQVRPKNKEQERVLAKHLAQALEFHRKNRMRKVLEDDTEGIFKANTKRKALDANWSPDRHYRRIASIPKEMVYVAEKIWGEDVLTNPQKFKEAFVKDEMGQYCLTVDPKSI